MHMTRVPCILTGTKLAVSSVALCLLSTSVVSRLVNFVFCR
jgi:hypothetical protein